MIQIPKTRTRETQVDADLPSVLIGTADGSVAEADPSQARRTAGQHPRRVTL